MATLVRHAGDGPERPWPPWADRALAPEQHAPETHPVAPPVPVAPG